MFLHFVYLPTFYISCCQPEFSGDVIAVTYTIIVNGGYNIQVQWGSFFCDCLPLRSEGP